MELLAYIAEPLHALAIVVLIVCVGLTGVVLLRNTVDEAFNEDNWHW
jgi:hypothetical protein